MTEVYHMYWPVGAHTSFSKRIAPTLVKSINYGMYTTQFFMGSSMTYARQQITTEDIEESKRLLRSYNMNVFTHFPYIANLAGSTKQLAWNGDKQQDFKMNLLLKELEYELNIIAQLSTPNTKTGVVIHPGSYPNRHLGHLAVAQSIDRINFAPNAKLLLEISAGEGTKLCKTIPEIASVIENTTPEKQQYLGVCIDTAHIFGSGEYNLSEISEVDKLFSDFDQYIGLSRFTLLHLNDSGVKFGKKRDKHALIGTGYIWKDNTESLVYLLNSCKQLGIPILLETEDTDMFTLYGLQPVE